MGKRVQLNTTFSKIVVPFNFTMPTIKPFGPLTPRNPLDRRQGGKTTGVASVSDSDAMAKRKFMQTLENKTPN
jgi:hypothetical protein